ncbi:hypothetical protein CY35_01G025600 [Sphagnum magellanicum]|nr:hypothetical protein CY35_01G025600 [Sphagnum magellanicum]
MGSNRASEYVKDNDVRLGLRVSTRAANGGPQVTRLQCRFYIAFGRKEKVGAKRQASTVVQGWMRPFRYDNIKSHVSGQHPTKWAKFKQLDSIVDRQAFFDDVPIAFKNYIKAYFPSSSLGVERQIVFDIEKDIVDVIIRGMMFDPANIVDNDANTLAKEQALSLFQRVDQEEEEEGNASYSYSVIIPKSKTTIFQLSVRYVSCGASFWLASNILSCTYDVLHNPVLHACSRHDVANYIRFVCAINLQHIARHLSRAWAFSIALDSATHQSTSYLDVRFRIFMPTFYNIVNLHAVALPMFDWHTGEVMFQMVVSFLDVICLGWKVHLLGVSSDGACNMTGRVSGVVTCLSNAMHNECPLTRVWCGAHQLNLVMEHIMDTIVKERFFIVMKGFITHLTRQLNLIANMKTTCPRVLLAHVESKQPPSAPPRLWWVSLLAMHHFTSRMVITFRTIQGLTMLLDQQQAALVGLIASFMEDVGVTGPLTAEAIANFNASSHIISGCYAVPLSSVCEFISGLASWVDSIVDEANEGQRNELFNDIASVYVTACNHIFELSAYRNENNNPLADPSSFPPQVLKQSINALFSQSAFKDGWSLLGRQFPNLMEFCGVIATLFLGTSTVESDFSILCWEKDAFRKSLSDFGLEGML